MCKTWPSADELFAGVALPAELAASLKDRYQRFGGEYASDQIEPSSGLPINQCWFKDNLVDVEEELIDATFNAIVHLARVGGSDQLFKLCLRTWWLCKDLQRANLGTPLPSATGGSSGSGTASDGARPEDSGASERSH